MYFQLPVMWFLEKAEVRRNGIHYGKILRVDSVLWKPETSKASLLRVLSIKTSKKKKIVSINWTDVFQIISLIQRSWLWRGKKVTFKTVNKGNNINIIREMHTRSLQRFRRTRNNFQHKRTLKASFHGRSSLWNELVKSLWFGYIELKIKVVT